MLSGPLFSGLAFSGRAFSAPSTPSWRPELMTWWHTEYAKCSNAIITIIITIIAITITTTTTTTTSV